MTVKTAVFSMVFLALSQLYATQDVDIVQSIIEDYIQIIGGQENLNRIETIQYEYTMDHLLEKEKIVSTVYVKKPHFRRRGDVKSEQVWLSIGDTHYAGKRDPGSEKLKWQKRSMKMLDSYYLSVFGFFMDYHKRGLILQYLGKENRFGKSVHQIKMTYSEKASDILFFDCETKQFVGFQDQRGFLNRVYGYERIGPYTIPTIWEVEAEIDGRKIHHINTKSKIIINPEFSAELFKTPPVDG